MSHQPCPRCGEVVRDPDEPDFVDQVGGHRCRGFRLKMTSNNDRPMVAEYDCPAHGRFPLEVARDASGDPPASVTCPRDLCGCESSWCVSATRGTRVRRVEVERGGYQRPERPTWTDTTNLGEGQDLEDWQADRDKVWEADHKNEVMQLAKELG